MTALMTLLALVLDYFFGELPNRWHPLIWFGKVAIHVEYRFNQSTLSNWQAFWHGLAATLLLVIVPVSLLIIALMILPVWMSLLLQVVVLWFCIGWNSLTHHVKAIATPLSQGDLPTARQALSFIVSRDTQSLSERKVATATIESLLENGNDAIFASLFWFVIGGAPAALAHRLINTLDAMWGYRTTRFEYFGKAAAKIDDALNYLPARLTALSYALVSPRRQAAFACWQRQAHKHDSPNAGVVMATGAGALGLRLGGSASYDGVREQRPIFGFGKTPSAKDINHALRLVNKTLLLWLVLIAAVYL